jgi:hypothetical protein
MKHFLACLTLALGLSGCGKVVVKPFNGTQSAPDVPGGVIYALPKTVVRVQLKVDKVTRTAAPFAAYSPIFAPSLSPVCADVGCTAERTVSYSIEDGATFAPYGEPDPENVFVVEYSGSGAIDQNLTMTWNDSGLLSSATATVTNRTVDVITSTASLVGTLVAKTAFAGGAITKAKPVPTCEEVVGYKTLDANDAAVLAGIGGDTSKPQPADADPSIQTLLMTNYCNMDPKDRHKIQYDSKSFKAAAAIYLDRVYPLIKSEGDILDNSTSALEPASFLTRLDTEITSRLTPLFIGTKATTTWNGTLDYRGITKTTALPLHLPLLTVTAAQGLQIAQSGGTDVAVVPVDMVAIPKKFKGASDAAPQTFYLDVNFAFPLDQQLFKRVKDDSSGDRSFRYRVPAQVHATLTDGTDAYAGSSFAVAQLGTILSLPPSRHSKSLTYTLGFVESTGALKTFTLGTTGGLDVATISAYGTTAGGVLDARNAAAAAAATAATAGDPILTKQDNDLKLQDDICTIKQKYGQSCTIQP